MFSAIVCERLGWYVYALAEPRDNQVFYVGKGKDNRLYAHEAAVVDGAADDVTSSLPEADVDAGTDGDGGDDDDAQVLVAKLARIRDIQAAGGQVQRLVVRQGLRTSDDLFTPGSRFPVLYLNC
jgi:hypothetical protein